LRIVSSSNKIWLAPALLWQKGVQESAGPD
jgi:hypothetical protein